MVCWHWTGNGPSDSWQCSTKDLGYFGASNLRSITHKSPVIYFQKWLMFIKSYGPTMIYHENWMHYQLARSCQLAHPIMGIYPSRSISTDHHLVYEQIAGDSLTSHHYHWIMSHDQPVLLCRTGTWNRRLKQIYVLTFFNPLLCSKILRFTEYLLKVLERTCSLIKERCTMLYPSCEPLHPTPLISISLFANFRESAGVR